MTAPIKPEPDATLLQALTQSPFADSLFQILGRPDFRVIPDQSQQTPTGTAHLGGNYTRQLESLRSLIGLTPMALQHQNEQGDPLNHGYPPISGQKYGEHALTHEYGHHVQSESRPGNSEFFHGVPPTPFVRGMQKLSDSVQPEVFAERFNVAVQFLRSGDTNLRPLDADSRKLVQLLRTLPIYERHPLNLRGKAQRDATAVGTSTLPPTGPDLARHILASLRLGR